MEESLNFPIPWYRRVAVVGARGPDGEGAAGSERLGGGEVESGELEPMGGHGDGDEVDGVGVEACLVEDGRVAAVFGFSGEERGSVGEVAGAGFGLGLFDHLLAGVAADAVGEVVQEVPDGFAGPGADVHAEVAFALVVIEDGFVEGLRVRAASA